MRTGRRGPADGRRAGDAAGTMRLDDLDRERTREAVGGVGGLGLAGTWLGDVMWGLAARFSFCPHEFQDGWMGFGNIFGSFGNVRDGFGKCAEGFRKFLDGFRSCAEGFRTCPDGFRSSRDGFGSSSEGFRKLADSFRDLVEGIRGGVRAGCGD